MVFTISLDFKNFKLNLILDDEDNNLNEQGSFNSFLKVGNFYDFIYFI